ncbi:LysR substrate-binding domain-containing protein [Paenibacillaceae bacterium WGS1546]|uniref:LysR substrate-binding domain-containing protein n=1 Tax=Cohnella sp. WGS1546 TaxID=3366810 RepID=UPI00372D32F5
MNMQQLKAFVLAVDLQKLNLVALKLGVTQPTVTFHLNKLQEELGVSLFHARSYHVLKLTDAGQAFYHYASQIGALSAEAESLMDVYRGTAAGRLAIGSTHTPATYMLPPLLSRTKRDFPRLELLLEVCPAPVIMAKIKKYELDVGIISQTGFDDADFVVTPLVRDDLVLIFSPDHPFASSGELRPDMLADMPFVSHEQGSISRQLIDRWAEERGVRFDISLEVSSSEALKAAVRHGIGFGMIAEASLREELAEGKLLARPIPAWTADRRIYAIRHRNKLVSHALRTFWSSLESSFATTDLA